MIPLRWRGFCRCRQIFFNRFDHLWNLIGFATKGCPWMCSRSWPFQEILYKMRALASSSTIRIRPFPFGAVPETVSRGGESAPEAREKKSHQFCMIHNCTLPTGCHALSQLTNHAPSKPTSAPSSGLDTANQNGITSLNGIVSPSASAA